MSTIVMNKKDEIIMKLVHYFITEENYNGEITYIEAIKYLSYATNISSS